MNEAVRTAASPAGTWAVVIVAVAALAFWLSALAIVSRNPGGRRRHPPGMTGPVLGGTHVSDCGRSVAPGWREATFDGREADHYLGTLPLAPEPGAAPAGTNVTVVPGQRTAGPPAGQPETDQPKAPVMPAQRTGDAGRPAKTVREG